LACLGIGGKTGTLRLFVEVADILYPKKACRQPIHRYVYSLSIQ
jgi:hypothetical protein